MRGFFNLTDDKDSFFVLRENRTDPSVEYRIALPAGAQLIVDTQRLWHAATHVGTEPRYCLITSWTSGPELDAYIEKYNGVNNGRERRGRRRTCSTPATPSRPARMPPAPRTTRPRARSRSRR